MEQLGKNIEFTVEGSTLTLKIDLSKSFGQSKSGKSQIIATTSGNKSLTGEYDDIKIGINCYKPL